MNLWKWINFQHFMIAPINAVARLRSERWKKFAILKLLIFLSLPDKSWKIPNRPFRWYFWTPNRVKFFRGSCPSDFFPSLASLFRLIFIFQVQCLFVRYLDRVIFLWRSLMINDDDNFRAKKIFLSVICDLIFKFICGNGSTISWVQPHH